MYRNVFLALVISMACVISAQAQTKHPLSLADMSMLKGLGSPELSPDGRRIALSVSQTDIENFESRSVIELIDIDSGESTTLIEGSYPQWSPDGSTIAYQGNHDDQRGLWLIDLDTKEKRFLTEIHRTDHFLGHRSRKNWAWSPDGKWIAYIGAEPSVKTDPESDVKVYSRTLYKTRTGFSDDRNVHVWVVTTTGSGKAKCITPGEFDEHSLAWSPNSNRIAFCSNRSQNPDHNYSDDIFTIDIESGSLTRITKTPGTETSTSYSPNGKWIAYHATVKSLNTKDSPPENTQLYIIPSDGGLTRCLTRLLDRRVRDYKWHPNSDSINFTAGDHGKRPIFRVNIETTTIERRVDGPFSVNSFVFDVTGDSLIASASGSMHPTEIWQANADLNQYRKITSYQDDFMKAVDLKDIESFWFDSFDDTKVQGWVMKPVGYVEGETYPAILSVHGGPHGMYGYSYSSRFQWYAANGYGVVFINPRGSTGYGQAFANGCVLNWGGGDYKDLMAGLDHAIAENDWIDADRLGLIGGSYGGFMTNWIITQTDRFKAAVAVASVSNLISFYGTSLYQLLIEVEFNGMPWDNYDLLWHFSPLRHVKNVTTPTLFIHGENDHDVPITQAEEMYIALKKLGVETVLARYPGEGHGFRQPRHTADYMKRVIEWFDGHVK